ncbi:hypothetical protein RRG08_034071 [Elysia crispata]|uniref:Uncharacterized protein n=1 Tax=Elysia crispata TaxID=231223 RepID=A0AAE1D0Y7_9GAST|nr:hypothetical protein RRG08_034071 [Elysia crispata]
MCPPHTTNGVICPPHTTNGVICPPHTTNGVICPPHTTNGVICQSAHGKSDMTGFSRPNPSPELGVTACLVQVYRVHSFPFYVDTVVIMVSCVCTVEILLCANVNTARYLLMILSESPNLESFCFTALCPLGTCLFIFLTKQRRQSKHIPELFRVF